MGLKNCGQQGDKVGVHLLGDHHPLVVSMAGMVSLNVEPFRLINQHIWAFTSINGDSHENFWCLSWTWFYSFTAVGLTKLFLSNSKNDVHPAPGERNDGMGVPVLHSKAKSNMKLGICNL